MSLTLSHKPGPCFWRIKCLPPTRPAILAFKFTILPIMVFETIGASVPFAANVTGVRLFFPYTYWLGGSIDPCPGASIIAEEICQALGLAGNMLRSGYRRIQYLSPGRHFILVLAFVITSSTPLRRLRQARLRESGLRIWTCGMGTTLVSRWDCYRPLECEIPWGNPPIAICCEQPRFVFGEV